MGLRQPDIGAPAQAERERRDVVVQLLSNWAYRIENNLGAVTARTYPAGGAPPVLTDECEGCTRYMSEHRRVPSLPGSGVRKPC